MAIQKVGVVGCGLMGSGIAQVCAAAGFPTTVREVSAELVDKGLKGIEKNLNRLVEKGTITRSEERRVGKECRSRRSWRQQTQKPGLSNKTILRGAASG